jgi:Sulfotransferase family
MKIRRGPIIVTGAGHSGTRGLVTMLEAVDDVYLGDINNVFKEWDFYRLLARNVNAWLLSLPEVHDHNVISPEITRDFRASEGQRRQCVAHILSEIRDHLDISMPPPDAGAWVFKTPRTTLCLEIWHAVFPQAKFVNLVRDGRDVAAAKTSAAAGSVERRFELWRARVNRIWAYQKEGMPIIDFRYEDLPDRNKLCTLCETLGLPYSPRMHDRLAMNIGRGVELMRSLPYERCELIRYGYAPHFEHRSELTVGT